MSIRSVDMMVLFSKTSDVEKAQMLEQHQARMSQHNIAVEEQKGKEIQKTQVLQSDQENESGKIQQQRERNQGKKQGQREGEPEEELQAAAEDPAKKKFRLPAHTGIIDIRI